MDAWNAKSGETQMSLDFSLSWTVINGGGGSQFSPDWGTVESHLNEIWRQSGSVVVHLLSTEDTGPERLQVLSECGRYILMLGENTVDDYYVRTYDNGLNATGFTDLHGEAFPACAVFADFQIVLKAFRQFFETGDVSRDLLN